MTSSPNKPDRNSALLVHNRRTFLKASAGAVPTLGALLADSGNVFASSLNASQDEAKTGGTVQIGATASPTSLLLFYQPNWPTYQMVRHMYEPLVSLNEEEQPVPGLTTSWEISEDGLTYTLHLRDDVKFHDGTPFNAEAVKYNIELQMEDQDTRGYTYLTETAALASVDAVDEFTVQMVLGVPDVFFMLFLGGWDCCPVSPTAHAEQGEQFELHPVGTGPFKFSEYVPDSHLDLVRFDDYWGGTPNLDGLHIRIIPEPSVHTIEMQAGTLDISHGVPIEDISFLQDDGKVVELRVSPNVTFVSMNVAKEPTSELAVRQAIARAIDRDTIIDQTLYGLAEKSRAGSPSVSPYYIEDIPFIEYDPDESARILDEAGWVMGSDGIRMRDEQPLVLELLSTEFGTYGRNNEIIQEQLRQIGIDSTIELLEWGAYLDRWRAEGAFNITYMSFGASFFSNWLPPGLRSDEYWHIHQIRNSTDPELVDVKERLNKVIDDVRTTADPDERREKWREGAMLVRDYQLTFWLWHAQAWTVCQPHLKDYIYSYNGYELQTAWLDK